MNLESFDKTLEGLARVRRHFGDLLPNYVELEPLQHISMDNSAALACHTRYFTPRRGCFSPILHDFGPGVDPNGDLENLKGDAYVHTEDNVVQYLGETKKEDGSPCVNLKKKLIAFSF